MGEKIKVLINNYNKVINVNKGTTLLEIANDIQEVDKPKILLAIKDNKLCELTREVNEECEVTFLDSSDKDGNKTYKRSATFIMIKAIFDVFGKDVVSKIVIHYSLSKGYYCTIEKGSDLTQEELDRVKTRMLEIIKEDMVIEKRTVSMDEGIELFKNCKMYDKVNLFKYRRVSNLNLYKLGDLEDYFYGYMVPSTGFVQHVDLFLYDEGFVIQFPTRKKPMEVAPFEPQNKLFTVMKQSTEWGKMLDCDTVGALNDIIASGKINDLMLVSEALQEKRVAEIADEIIKNKDNKFVLIAGPSSSGKTTFSHRLSIQLKVHGVNPHPIAVDNYFVDREKTPLDEDGNYDFEVIEAIDVEAFNKDMNDLLDGKRVELPTFNFKIGRREYKGDYKQLEKDDILVIEGIHGLNDKLTYSLPSDSKFKIYISALTQLNIDEHNRIATTDGRLIRRMVRDYSYRGTPAQDTIARWHSVRRGEEQNIFPFQEEADVMFNSALIYELAVLKQYAEPLLFSIPSDSKEHIEAKRLIKFLDYFLGVSSEEVPKNSIIREFIGGSCFR